MISKLEILPGADESRRRFRTSWPSGWWIAGAAYCCCGVAQGHRIPHGRRIYLTGQSGEIFCAKHAPVKPSADLAPEGGQ